MALSSRSVSRWAALCAAFVTLDACARRECANPSRAESGAGGAAECAALRVLFVGNSFTFANDLPGTLEALSTGDDGCVAVQARSVALPGATLEHHWSEGSALKHIREGGWAFVVLQEQSTRPIDETELMLEYVDRFAKEIREVGAHPVLVMTWTKKREGERLQALRSAFQSARDASGVLVAPVAEAFALASEEEELYASDGAHPAALGTYLAACVLYTSLTGKEPPAPSRLRLREDEYGEPSRYFVLPEATAKTLSSIAWRAIEAREGPRADPRLR